MDTGCLIRMWYLMSKYIYMLIYMKVLFVWGVEALSQFRSERS
jgi:hypothetical protein